MRMSILLILISMISVVKNAQSSVEPNSRIDCHPDPGLTKDECINRGCTYDEDVYVIFCDIYRGGSGLVKGGNPPLSVLASGRTISHLVEEIAQDERKKQGFWGYPKVGDLLEGVDFMDDFYRNCVLSRVDRFLGS
uniref:P-type domain-containing protein n=1 Tax=Acrobeloides nanus TaxID=290746 RepID=A0A914EDK6_9BILA